MTTQAHAESMPQKDTRAAVIPVQAPVSNLQSKARVFALFSIILATAMQPALSKFTILDKMDPRQRSRLQSTA